jgi:hypothetical protein
MIIIFWEMTPCGAYKNRVISQKMIIIIVTAVETSNLTMQDFSIVTFHRLGLNFVPGMQKEIGLRMSRNVMNQNSHWKQKL